MKSNHIVFEIFKEFSSVCKTRKSLEDWWRVNKKALNTIETTDLATYKEIIGVFKQRSDEIKKERKSAIHD
mgnify:CR=1 FL=1|jgi:hypothetical protein